MKSVKQVWLFTDPEPSRVAAQVNAFLENIDKDRKFEVEHSAAMASTANGFMRTTYTAMLKEIFDNTWVKWEEPPAPIGMER